MKIYKNIFFKLFGILILLLSFFFSIRYSKQPLLEFFSFRQTQTAITTFWLLKNGFSFGYETPVIGYPWKIPFEFPFYQSIVALVSSFFKTKIDITGRLVSYFFLLACLIPIRGIVKKMKIDPLFFWIFIILFFSSPIYLFWGRTFMIETTAVFLTLTMLYYSLNFFNPNPNIFSSIYFVIFCSLALLQKVTTSGPLFLTLFVLIIFNLIKNKTDFKNSLRKIIILFFSFFIPLSITFFWIKFTDELKNENEYGKLLTSKSLSNWNYGTYKQIFNYNFLTFLWSRVAINIGGVLGIIIILFSLFKLKGKIRLYILLSFCLFFFPILIFKNLHIIHPYYQVSCILFLIATLTFSIVYAIPEVILLKGINLKLILVILLVVFNYSIFYKSYFQLAKKKINIYNNETLQISSILKKYTSKNSGIIVFGDDWNSKIPYYSERKSFVVPSYFREYDTVFNLKNSYLDVLPLGAVIFINKDSTKNLKNILNSSYNYKPHLFPLNSSCFIYLPNRKFIITQNGKIINALFN
jgi:hypothetical protein